MNKKAIIALLAAVTLLLSGCRLAVPEGAAEGAGEDRLAGYFITTEHLDLFDFETYLKENFKPGGTQIITDTTAYEQRVYAELAERTYTDVQGVKRPDWEYTFQELDGILWAEFWMTYPEEYKDLDKGIMEDGYWSSVISGEGLSEVKSHIAIEDNGESVQQSATIYVSDKTEEVGIYMNPVFQTAEGEVYLVSGPGLVGSIAGGSFSRTEKQEITKREGSEVKKSSYEYTVTVQGVSIPEEVVIFQMDENHLELKKERYTSGNLPKELDLEPETAYILVEEYCEGEMHRVIYQPGDEAIEVFHELDNGMCIQSRTTINWDGENSTQ